jgi:maleylpyruvate isomerase
MYSSPQARDAVIAEMSGLSAHELSTECLSAARRLTDAVRELPERAWDHEVRTAQGRIVPASEVLWMRCREVWVHAVDLDAGEGFADIPGDVLSALVDDVARSWSRRDETPEIRFDAGNREWGPGPVKVTGDLPELAAWVTGRGSFERLTIDGDPPSLPAWL